MVKIEVINKSVECYNEDPVMLREEMTIMAGKAAGICYMSDDYLSNGIQNISNAIKRAKRTANTGHLSVFEHGHLSLLIHTSKMMAMLLNSLNFYSTSEKSARYTPMCPETDLEQQMFNKWKARFVSLIDTYYHGKYSETDIEKLAMENARYMISVFTPTILEYTAPYNRLVMTVQWLYDVANTVDELLEYSANNDDDRIYHQYEYFYSRLSKECKQLANELGKILGISKEDPLIVDRKNIGIEFIRTVGYINKLRNIVPKEELFKNAYENSKRDEYFGDIYASKYEASFAAVAQDERHRTTHINIDLTEVHESYIPKIIRGSAYEIEWKNDFETLISNKIMPQGTMLEVYESGRFEDFYLKCKERLCSRSQLEIMEITREQVVKFAQNYDILCYMNQKMLDSMIRQGNHVNYKKPETIIVESRCRFSDFSCVEPCKIQNDTINYYRNI